MKYVAWVALYIDDERSALEKLEDDLAALAKDPENDIVQAQIGSFVPLEEYVEHTFDYPSKENP